LLQIVTFIRNTAICADIEAVENRFNTDGSRFEL